MSISKVGLLTAGLVAGEAAYNYFRRRSSPGVSAPTLSRNSTMAASRPPYRRMKPRFAMRRRRYSRPTQASGNSRNVVTYKRVTTVQNGALAAGTGSISQTIKLSDIYYADLQGVYDAYRIKKVTLCLMPVLDPGATGTAATSSEMHVTTACDPTGTAPIGYTSYYLSTIDNYKKGVIKGADAFWYKFFPKCKNTVDLAGVADPSGQYGKYNPWISFGGNGPTVPHYNIMAALNTGLATSTAQFTYCFTIEFDCLLAR